MRYRLCLCLLGVASWALLTGGCPRQPEEESDTEPTRPGRGSTTGTGLTPTGTGGSGDAGTGSSTVVVGGDTGSATSTPDALSVEFPGCTEPAEGAFWRSEVLRLVNQERVRQGLNAVILSSTLEAQATQYACEMIHYDFFGHENDTTGSTLTDRAAEFGYDYWIIGENLAAGQPSPAQAVADWLASPCHRENILNPAFTELGVGVRAGGDYGIYWVQEFGRPFTADPYAGEPYHDPECDHDD